MDKEPENQEGEEIPVTYGQNRVPGEINWQCTWRKRRENKAIKEAPHDRMVRKDEAVTK